jgi:hypothetical protein
LSASLVVVILLTAGDASDPAAPALVAAAEQALEPGTVVVVRETQTPATDDQAVAVADALRADAVAVVTWTDGERPAARIHLRARTRPRWVDRELAFRAADAPAERGRAAGFALASMVPLPAPGAEPFPPPGPPAAAAAPPAQDTKKPSISTFSDRGEIALLGAASAGLGGSAAAAGFGVELRLRASFLVGIRGGVSARFGSVAEAEASSRAVKLDVGPVLALVRTPSWSLGPRLDLGAVHHAVQRPTAAGFESTASRWIPATTTQLDARWTPTSGMVVGAAIGLEIAFGEARVLVDGRPVALIPPVRTVAELGVGLRF